MNDYDEELILLRDKANYMGYHDLAVRITKLLHEHQKDREKTKKRLRGW
jgi:hypothetical protein